MADLTPVERGVLVALMAAGGPLKEAAELGAQYGLRMTAWHRKRLVDMGLVRTTKAPFTHELTDKGWAFLGDGFPMDVPRNGMKLGALNALVEGVQKSAARRGETVRDMFAGKEQLPASPPPSPSPDKDEKSTEQIEADLMANAAWSESETMLAMALQAIPAFTGRLGALEKSIGDEAGPALKQVSLSAENVFQNVRMAASKRGLEALHERGATVAFDAVQFDSTDEMDDGEDALVMKQPITRRRDGHEIVILRGLAAPLD